MYEAQNPTAKLDH